MALEARGFKEHLAALNGSYTAAGDNHGKPTYSKPAQMQGANKCCVYFWDERDGDALAGWWMAPTVGGEQVWAHCPSRSPTPPPTGWKVPWHAASADPAVRVELKAKTAASWGAQPTAGAKGRPGAAPGGGKGGAGPAAGGWAAQQNDRNSAAQKIKKDNILKQIQNSVDQVEKVMKQIAENEAKGDGKFDKNTAVRTGRTSIATARRVMDHNLKNKLITEEDLTKQNGDITKYDNEINALEESVKKERAKKLKDIETALTGGEATKLTKQLESAVEKTKDAAVLFTCEMAEHIKPEDAIESNEKTEKEAKVAYEIIKNIKDNLLSKEKDIRMMAPAETEKLKTALKDLHTKVTGFEKELRTVKAQSAGAVNRAKAQLEKRKREEQLAEQKKERERVNQWNRDILGFIYQVNLVAENLAKNNAGKGLRDLSTSESRMMGLKAELARRMAMKECNPNSKKEFQRQLQKIDTGIEKIKKARIEVQNRNHDKLDIAAVQIAVSALTLQGEKSNTDFFAGLTNKGTKMSSMQFERFIKKLDVDAGGLASTLFSEICHLTGSGNDTLTCDEFFLHAVHNYYSCEVKNAHLTKEADPASEKVENGAVPERCMIDLLEGPKETKEGVIRAKCKTVGLKDGDKEGYITLRSNSNEAFKRYSPLYEVLAETVLTDTFSLKGFKVVRRIKADEKFRALSLPKMNEEASMLRVQGITSENENAWVTVQGNRGTPLLKNIPISKKDEKEIEPEEFNEDLLNGVLADMAKKELETAKTLKKEATAALKEVEKAIDELEEMNEEGKTPTKAEVDALVIKVEEAFKVQNQAAQKAKGSISNIAKQISNVDAGPFKKLQDSLKDIQEAVTETMTSMNEKRIKQRETSMEIKKKEKDRREAKELAAAEELAGKITKEVEGHQEKIVDMHTKLQEVDTSNVLQKDPNEMATELEAIRDLLTDAEALNETVKVWLTENQPKNTHAVLQKASQALQVCRQKNSRTVQQVQILKNQCAIIEVTMKERSQVIIGVTLSKHCAEKKKTPAEVFAKIAKTGKLDLEGLESFFHDIGCTSPCLELICTGLGLPLTADTFANLAEVNYRCTKRCLMTDALEVSACKKVRFIEPEEIVTIMEPHTVDTETEITRIKAKAVTDGQEGWMPIVGNKGSPYFKLRGPWYKVMRDTVFTDDFSMENVKVLRRLKVGDRLRCTQYPKKEEKTGLFRMQAVSLDDNTTGWVTIKGNQGSLYVVDCEFEAKEDKKGEEDEVTKKMDIDAEEKEEEVAEMN